MGELHLVDEVAWDPNAVLVEIDQRVDSAEDDGIRARWEFGQELLFQRVGEQLPKGRLDEVALLIGKSRSEVKHRMKFASDYPTAEEVDNAVSHFGSWHAIVNKGSVHFSSETPEWETPQGLFDSLNAEFAFTLDVCATAENAKCQRFFTETDDGLNQEWVGSCWMNPPYGDVIPEWIEKAWLSAQAGATVVCLVPARVDTAWWWDYCRFGEIRFLRGRLKSGGGETGAPFPSAVVVFPREPCVVWWER